MEKSLPRDQNQYSDTRSGSGSGSIVTLVPRQECSVSQVCPASVLCWSQRTETWSISDRPELNYFVLLYDCHRRFVELNFTRDCVSGLTPGDGRSWGWCRVLSHSLLARAHVHCSLRYRTEAQTNGGKCAALKKEQPLHLQPQILPMYEDSEIQISLNIENRRA